MVGIVEIGAGYNALKAAADIIRGLDATRVAVSINEVKIELQQLILEAQQGLFAAQQAQVAADTEIARLNRLIADSDRWDEKAAQYELSDTGNGGLAYRLHHDVSAGEPEHWLCATCFQQRRISFLIPETYAVGRTEVLKCPVCKAEMILRGLRQPQHR